MVTRESARKPHDFFVVYRSQFLLHARSQKNLKFQAGGFCLDSQTKLCPALGFLCDDVLYDGIKSDWQLRTPTESRVHMVQSTNVFRTRLGPSGSGRGYEGAENEGPVEGLQK